MQIKIYDTIVVSENLNDADISQLESRVDRHMEELYNELSKEYGFEIDQRWGVTVESENDLDNMEDEE